MPQLYALRRFSSWSFRLSVSVALLISSAGLAASLLVGAAVGNADAQQVSWQPSSRLSQPANELSPGLPASRPTLPSPLSRLVPAYAFASSTTVSAPPLSPANDQFQEPLPSADPTVSSPAGSLRRTVQQSWHTFKQAFR